MPVPAKKRPAWLSAAGLVASEFPASPGHAIAGRPPTDGAPSAPEPAPEATPERADADAALAALREAGITLVYLPFYRGYGLESEKETLAQAREWVTRAHAHHLRAAVRVMLGALAPETLLAEEPEAQNWLQVNPDGQTIPSDAAATGRRVRPCYQSEGFLRYMEKVCGAAVESGADLIHFEEAGYSPEPDTCRCPVCVAAYREMLREQYGAQGANDAAARFGHQSFTHLRPPHYAAGQETPGGPVLETPHEQEWAKFKVRTVARCLTRLARFIERKNSECAVGADLFRTPGVNVDWRHGINYAELLPHLDVAGEAPRKIPGQVPRRTRAFKIARACGTALMACHTAPAAEDYELGLAEALACEPLGLGNLADAWPEQAAATGEPSARAKTAREYAAFFRQHRETLFQGARPLATVAVYRDTPSLAFNSQETHRSQLRVEQTLLERHVPFEIIGPGHLDDLARFKAVVLANAECLPDSVGAKLRAYAEAGGGLLVTEDTGRYDECRRPRARALVADWFGPEFPAPSRGRFGAGAVAYVPRLDPPACAVSRDSGTASDPAASCGPADWAPPRNADELLDALRFVAGEMPCRAAALGRFFLEPYELPSGARVVQVVSLEPKTPVRGLEVSLACAQAPRQVQALSPGREPQRVAFQFDERRQRVTFRWEEVSRYVAFLVR